MLEEIRESRRKMIEYNEKLEGKMTGGSVAKKFQMGGGQYMSA